MAGDATGGWIAPKASTDGALTDSEVRAAPGAGKYLVVEQVIFSNEGTANSFLLEYDTTAVYGPVYLGANQTFNSGLMPFPITLAANKALTVTTTAADHSNTIVHGYTK